MTGTVVHRDRDPGSHRTPAGRAASRVRFELGRRTEPRGVSALTPGSVVDLDRAHDGPVDVYADGRLMARGEAIVVNGRLAVRVLEIVNLSRERRTVRA